jgi:beta-lactamase regulating signal transducer with metallopeptidase domain
MESLVHILLSNAVVATLMAVVVAAVSRICRRPALTHSLWLVVMLKLVTPPLVPVSLPLANAFSPIGTSPAIVHIDRGARPGMEVAALAQPYVDESAPCFSNELFSEAQTGLTKTEPEVAEIDDIRQSIDLSDGEPHITAEFPFGWRWEPLVLVMVLAGALGWWTLTAMRIIQFQRLLKDVQPAPNEWQSHTDLIADRMGLGWCPSVYLVPGRLPPMLWAIGGRTRLLVPTKLWTGMGTDERTSLLLHELAHLKRRDHWVRWLELVVAGLYWWHPVVWWARRALREAEEQCCDAWVVWAMPDRARTYASALLAAVEFVSGARPVPAAASATSGSGHVSCLKRRLRMIVRAKTPKGLTWAGRIGVLCMAALLLPLAPSWAQKSETEQATKERNESLRKLAVAVGSDDRQTLALKQQFAMEHLATIHKELLDVQSQKRQAQATLKVLQQAAGPAAEAEIDRSKEIEQAVAMLDDLENRLTAEIASLSKENQSLAINIRALTEIQDRVKKRDVARERIAEEFKNDPEVLALEKEIAETRKHLEHIKLNIRQPHDPARVAAQNRLDKLQEEYNYLRRSKYGELATRLTPADDKDDDDKDEKARDVAERFQEQLQDLISKLGKELSPVTEEVRKALERAVGEVHQSLEKDGLSAEGLGKALEKSQEELRKAFEGGGAVDRELREAIDRARKDMQEAFDRTKEDIQDQAESLRQQSRTLRDQARENFERARGEAERRIGPDGDDQPNRDELESARKEIRELQQQLQRATRRLDELQRRESRRGPARRREPNPQPEPQPQNRATPRAEPAPPAAPAEPAVPATPARPARPNARRPLPPIRPTPGAGRRGPQIENDKRLHELEDKMNQLLKELKDLKDEKSPKESK